MTPAPLRTRSRARRAARPVAAAIVLAVVAGGCSFDTDEPATVTMPELNTTTTTTPEGSGRDELAGTDAEPLPVAWIRQIGGPGEDVLNALTGSGATVVAVGRTARTRRRSHCRRQRRADRHDRHRRRPRHLDVRRQRRRRRRRGGDRRRERHAVRQHHWRPRRGFRGAQDAFCAPVDTDGALGQATQLGGPESERATGIGTSAEVGYSFVSGTLDGLLPGAQDPSGRGLGNGDALMMQADPEGRPIWARQFGTGLEDGALAAGGAPDGDGLTVGYTDGDLEGPSKGGRDGWVSRFDPSGNQRWIAQLGSSGTDTLSAVNLERRGAAARQRARHRRRRDRCGRRRRGPRAQRRTQRPLRRCARLGRHTAVGLPVRVDLRGDRRRGRGGWRHDLRDGIVRKRFRRPARGRRSGRRTGRVPRRHRCRVGHRAVGESVRIGRR